MLARLAALCPSQVLQRIGRLVEPLKSACVAKLEANSAKQEYEKQHELKRSALSAVLALQVHSHKRMQTRVRVGCRTSTTFVC